MLKPSVLITGAAGYLGQETLQQLAQQRDKLRRLVAMDVRDVAPEKRLAGVEYIGADIRSPEMAAWFKEFSVDIVVHLAAIVTPGRRSHRELEYSVDVLGTENVLKACVEAGVKKIIVTSSGAAYGYHPDNPAWLQENHPLRGNEEFAYSYHKRLVEEMLARYREQHPDLQQLVFRPGVVLGKNVNNQITALFEKKFVLGLRGAESPFVFVWDQDVAACLVKGVLENKTGIYNLAGDGALSMREIAAMLKKPYLPLPATLVKSALWLLRQLRLSQYGPEQVNFLRYRPVLSNQKLKTGFGYVPSKNAQEVFEYYLSEKAVVRKYDNQKRK
ncbi:MAG: SDR family oxidoreductase [candidate division KSB1 bacterium]|nr:SDR family oxidoreductase [candidate division KSB1 bacterium]MDZ7368244.1 SDR family oxidoreductase [candidate division KSB1 bacterium]MDZ7406774.1 SDR family oxidoreductase [candidate division KSB1 bacterium]